MCATCSVLGVATMWFLPHRGPIWPIAVVETVTTVLALVTAAARPRVELPSRWLLVFPAFIVASVLADAFVSKTVASTYTGFFTLCFIYVGFTQPRWAAIRLVPPIAAVWWLCQAVPWSVSAVKLPITVAIWVLISEILVSRVSSSQAQIGRLSDDAQTDPLTGLGNRRALNVALRSLGGGDTIVVIDLDFFKEVNDALGHEAGDRVITEFAGAVKRTLRSGDLAYRYGGEEIVAVLRQGNGNANGAEAMLRRLRADWCREGRPTFSAGASVHVQGSAEHAFRRADVALYAAKRAGRDTWRVHEGAIPATGDHDLGAPQDVASTPPT